VTERGPERKQQIVARILHWHSLQHPPIVLPPSEIERAIDDYFRGVSVRELAERIHYDTQIFSRMLRHYEP
jgi:hypothetical protein